MIFFVVDSEMKKIEEKKKFGTREKTNKKRVFVF